MGFNRRKMEDQRRDGAEKQAASRRATDAQVLEDAERLIAAWNERQAKRMPMIFSPTIGAAITARYWFLWVRCPACRTINAIDLRTLDRQPRRGRVEPHSQRCHADRAGRTRPLPNWCDCRGRASPTKCARSIAGECLGNSGPARVASRYSFRKSSGSSAMFAAIRRVSSCEPAASARRS